MRRAKKIGIVCVGILMIVFMFLSYSNLFGGETERDITKISVIGIKRKNSQVEDFKRGIEEAANAKRVDVEYLELEEDYDTIKEYIDREIKNGSQALIVFSEKEEQILSYLQSEKKKIPLILVNPGGTEEKTIRVWFDVQDMAECLAEKIHQKRQEEETVVYLTDEKEMSERMWTIFQETFQKQGIAIEKKKMTLPNLAKYRDQKQQAVFICSSPKITEETADYLKSKNPRLHTDEVLIALSASAATNPDARLALQQLSKLNGCQAHTSVMLSDVDIRTFKRLGVQLTCEAVYETGYNYH